MVDAQPLAGRTILITGASSGIGAQFARAFAAQGAALALAARRKDRLEELVAELEAGGSKAAAIAMDVADEASIIAGFDAAEAALGPINALVNNAGMNLQGAPTDLTAQDFDAIFAVNVRGVFLCAREAAKRMFARKEADGRILNIASMGGLKVLPGLFAYCSSKAAVVMMTKSLARDWARKGVNVNALCPGYIETELNAQWLGEEGGQKMIAGFPRKRVMPIETLDGIAAYCLGPHAKHVTGAVFSIDDGQSL